MNGAQESPNRRRGMVIGIVITATILATMFFALAVTLMPICACSPIPPEGQVERSQGD